MEQINYYLSGYIMPALLLAAGVLFAVKLKAFFLLHPLKLIKTLAEAGDTGSESGARRISPFRALTQALAGTLGVGNMAGVATAICSGGAGAVFWMWLSALCAMSVKYIEVSYAVERRRGSAGHFIGGAMYYIRDTFSDRFPKIAAASGGFFAVLCLANSLLTGNIVQMNAAASAQSIMPPLILGGIIAAVSFIISCGGAASVTNVTLRLIPFLSAAYIIISMFIIITNADRLPTVVSKIISEAFSVKAAAGGTGGYVITRAVRFGVTRGIFSNEAGCGTSPSAHASADTKSPHHQGCFGIFEVFADTIVLCTMTAFVILLSGITEGLDGIPITLRAYSMLAGDLAGYIIGASVVLFAFATVICQSQYGSVAIGYLTGQKNSRLRYIYYLLSALCTVAGCVISSGLMWQLADFIISLMTALNVFCLLAAFFKGKLPAK